MKHALSFYITDDSGLNELGANAAVVKSNLRLNGQPLTTEEFLRFAENPKNAEAYISHDIYNTLNYPGLVVDKNEFADFLLKAATLVAPVIYVTNDNDKNEEVY